MYVYVVCMCAYMRACTRLCVHVVEGSVYLVTFCTVVYYKYKFLMFFSKSNFLNSLLENYLWWMLTGFFTRDNTILPLSLFILSSATYTGSQCEIYGL
jgi:hypothetical protein